MTDAGQIVLVVPGAFPDGALALGVHADFVTLAADGQVFVQVDDIDAMIIDTLATQGHIDLISVPDDDTPPSGITHQAAIDDNRQTLKGVAL